jgi:hypothetical protein
MYKGAINGIKTNPQDTSRDTYSKVDTILFFNLIFTAQFQLEHELDPLYQ